MTNIKEIKANLKYEKEILKLIDTKDDYNRGDLQARVEGLVMYIRSEMKKEVSK